MAQNGNLRRLDPLPGGVGYLRGYRAGYSLVECRHDPGYRRTHDGALDERCRVCGGDAKTTGNFTWPVKMLVYATAPKPSAPQSESLF